MLHDGCCFQGKEISEFGQRYVAIQGKSGEADLREIRPARLCLAGRVSRWGWLLVHWGEAIVSAMSFEIPEQAVVASPDVVGELRRHQLP